MHLVNQTNVQSVLELSARRRDGYLVVLSTCLTKRWNGYDKRAILEYLCGQEHVREASADDKSSSGFSQDLLDDVKTKIIKEYRDRKITTETRRLQSLMLTRSENYSYERQGS